MYLCVCVFMSYIHSCPREFRIVLYLGYCYFATEMKSHGIFFKRHRVTWSHREQLVSEYEKAQALMMTGKSSLWDLGGEQMDTARRGTGWNSSGKQGLQIIAYAVVNVSGD